MCVWPIHDQAIQVGSESVLHNMIYAFFGKMEPNWMWEVGSSVYDPAHFWLPKCFRIRSGKFTGSVATNSDLFDTPRAACTEPSSRVAHGSVLIVFQALEKDTNQREKGQ